MHFVFTESGVAMLSSVLHSSRAIQVNIEIMRAFVQIRKQIRMGSLENKLELFRQKLDNLEILLREQKPLKPLPSQEDPVYKIQDAVAKYWGIETKDLKSSIRSRKISVPRQIAIYLIRKQLNLSFSEIGSYFGERDHSTMMHSYQKIEMSLHRDIKIQHAISVLQC